MNSKYFRYVSYKLLCCCYDVEYALEDVSTRSWQEVQFVLSHLAKEIELTPVYYIIYCQDCRTQLTT